jgi:beta-N-acetylhexosaminidase
MRGGLGRTLQVGAIVLVAALATAALYLLVVRDDDDADGSDAGPPRAEVPEPVRELVGGLNSQQKVDQILMLGFEGTDAGTPLAVELEARQLGGVLVRRENWLDASQGAALVGQLREVARSGGAIPPLFAAAQEGGEHRALLDLPPEERQLNLGDIASEQAAEDWAREAGEALRDAGVEMNLAPLADVATIASPLADRVFSDDPAIVAPLTAAAVRGCAAAGIACAVRHFPGLGAASASTDQGPATVGLDPATLASRDLPPFEAAIAAGVPAVMLSHAYYVAYDPVTPGSLSPAIATGLLRDQLGFEGVAVTDDLGAGAIRATHPIPRAAVEAINAGADLVLIGGPSGQPAAREALLAAVETGEIPPERIDQAAGRVLELKRRLGLLDGAP